MRTRNARSLSVISAPCMARISIALYSGESSPSRTQIAPTIAQSRAYSFSRRCCSFTRSCASRARKAACRSRIAWIFPLPFVPLLLIVVSGRFVPPPRLLSQDHFKHVGEFVKSPTAHPQTLFAGASARLLTDRSVLTRKLGSSGGCGPLPCDRRGGSRHLVTPRVHEQSARAACFAQCRREISPQIRLCSSPFISPSQPCTCKHGPSPQAAQRRLRQAM